MPYPHTSRLQQSGLLLGWGQGASTPFAFNKEPGSSLGRWTALSTRGISVPKNMPVLVKTRCRKASSYFCRIGLLLPAGFGQDTFSVKQLQLVGTLSNKLKGQKAVREFLQIMSDEQGLERETVQRTPLPRELGESSVSLLWRGMVPRLLSPWLPVFSQR